MTPNKAKEEKKYKLDYVSGVEGNSIYLEDYRIAGNRPWGGGNVVKSWEITSADLKKALPDLFASAERDAVERTLERCRRIALDLKDKHLDDSLKYLGGYIEACEEIADVIKKQST